MKPVAITGFNLCNALGNNRDQVSQAIKNGQCGLTPVSIDVPFDTFTGAISDLPELQGSLSDWSTRMGQMALLLVQGLESEIEAMRKRWPAQRIGIFLGTTTAGAERTESAYRSYLESGELPRDYDLWRHHTYGAILHVMRELTGAQGPGHVASTACTASAKPLASAQRLIAADVIDAAIVGGIDTLCSMTLRGFHTLGVLSETLCCPFSSERSGLNIGEGGALMLLERDGNAHALLEAVGESSDAYHITAPDPKGNGARLAMERALAIAGCSGSDIDYVNAHGTGTKLNDLAESLAIGQIVDSDTPVVSTKCYTGHTLGAAGATEAAISLLALTEGWIPAALRSQPRDERITLRIPESLLELPVKRVLSNSLAFGGNNTSVLLRRV